MLILAKYTLDRPARHRLWAYLFDDRMTVSRRAGWPFGEPGHVERLCTYAVAECLDPNRCRKCEGVGSVLVDVKRECPTCQGTGVRYWGDRRLAGMFRCGVPTFRNLWKPRIMDARAVLQRWEEVGLDGLERGLRWGRSA